MGVLMSYSMVGIGLPKPGAPTKSWDQQMVDIVGRKIKLGFDRRGGSTAPNCTLFYAKSSLPGAGYSVFAGREYAVGDVVVRTVTVLYDGRKESFYFKLFLERSTRRTALFCISNTSFSIFILYD